jgi:hypothetical protein
MMYASEPDVTATLVEEFKTFRAQRVNMASSVFARKAESAPISAVSSTPIIELSNKVGSDEIVQMLITGANEQSSICLISSNTLLRSIAEAYALKCGVPVNSYTFRLNDVDLNIDLTGNELGLNDRAAITASVKSYQGNFLIMDDVVEHHFGQSQAKYILQVLYEPGAAVRTGIEIEGSAAVFTLSYKEVTEAFHFAFTQEGIQRYRIGEGWISDRLRGGTE